ncbi:hypothetical protein CKA38_11350 [Ereboglobus luteus]|uniref:Phospholipase D-like domain-containing protein n=2 Tax=Ereboglobus luteus TaxID=1796921 RepID=A0A2U8E5D0_9BACT|nr:hypothetical protein CKA38_11350 [Ereboglobus luteus]
MLSQNPQSLIAAFAYVTDSGAAQMHGLKDCFKSIQHCRWIFGIDYGRSHPTAIRKMAELAQNSEIRIYDGAHVVKSQSFTPRKSFHLKTVVAVDGLGKPSEQLVGSGNLSGLGLTSGIEAGCLINYERSQSAEGIAVVSILEQLWEESVPFDNIINEYENLWTKATAPVVVPRNKPEKITRKLFWVDVGYVTKNRGNHRPGNQFDLPRGSHIHLGLNEVSNPTKNSLLGELRMRTPDGVIIQRSLRFGNNAMEKLTLPTPEQHGYGAYDGKILTFERQNDTWALEAFEHDDFKDAYGKHIDWFNEMQSGRLFGTIAIRS